MRTSCIYDQNKNRNRQNHHASLLSLELYLIILFSLCNPKVALIPWGSPFPGRAALGAYRWQRLQLPHPAQSNKPFGVCLDRALGGITAPVPSSARGKKGKGGPYLLEASFSQNLGGGQDRHQPHKPRCECRI